MSSYQMLSDEAAVENQIRAYLKAHDGITLRELRETLGQSIDTAEFSLAVLTLVNRGQIELTEDRKLHDLA